MRLAGARTQFHKVGLGAVRVLWVKSKGHARRHTLYDLVDQASCFISFN